MIATLLAITAALVLAPTATSAPLPASAVPTSDQPTFPFTIADDMLTEIMGRLDLRSQFDVVRAFPDVLARCWSHLVGVTRARLFDLGAPDATIHALIGYLCARPDLHALLRVVVADDVQVVGLYDRLRALDSRSKTNAAAHRSGTWSRPSRTPRSVN